MKWPNLSLKLRVINAVCRRPPIEKFLKSVVDKFDDLQGVRPHIRIGDNSFVRKYRAAGTACTCIVQRPDLFVPCELDRERLIDQPGYQWNEQSSAG